MIGDPYEELMRSIGTIKPAYRPKGSAKAKSRVGIFVFREERNLWRHKRTNADENVSAE